ncbi:unnamed protein product [Spirodela intermedia]|uniref:Uncharacterized protein n=1 Tax=Spirodela intermedia TaxID=51605 RepID=A0A7I8LHC1_SPIIN|nr:unnamed protein product [Spirodela intermedia]
MKLNLVMLFQTIILGETRLISSYDQWPFSLTIQ